MNLTIVLCKAAIISEFLFTIRARKWPLISMAYFVFSELIKDKLGDGRMVEPRRSDFFPEVENKMKQLNIAGIRPVSEGWAGGEAGPGQLRLQPPTLPEEGEFYDCKVSHVVSPAEVYLQSYSSLGKYQSMNKVISAFYKGNAGISVTDPVPGRFSS